MPGEEPSIETISMVADGPSEPAAYFSNGYALEDGSAIDSSDASDTSLGVG